MTRNPRRMPTPMPTATPFGLREVDPLPPEPPRRDWRADVRSASALSWLAGVWLALSPLIVGYEAGDQSWSPVVAGAIVVVLAFARLAGAYTASWLSYVSALVGTWLLVSAFLLQDSAEASWNEAVLGVIVFALGLLAAAASDAGGEGRQ